MGMSLVLVGGEQCQVRACAPWECRVDWGRAGEGRQSAVPSKWGYEEAKLCCSHWPLECEFP